MRVNNSSEKSKTDFFSLLKSIIGRAVIKIGSSCDLLRSFCVCRQFSAVCLISTI